MNMSCKSLSMLLFLTMLGSAQDRGTIRGTVTDESGASIPEAVVTARNEGTGVQQTAKTNADGVYNFLYVQVGNYTVTTERVGFRKAEVTGVRVDVATVADLNVQLTV